MAGFSDDDGCFEENEGVFGIDTDSGEEELDPTDRNYKEPTTHRSCVIPVNKEECIGFDPSCYNGTVDPNKKIFMACGCTAFLGDILTEETKICNAFKSSNLQQPEEDVLLTLFCGKCPKQITDPFSAWIIYKYHGFANWIMQNFTEKID